MCMCVYVDVKRCILLQLQNILPVNQETVPLSYNIYYFSNHHEKFNNAFAII